VQRGCITRGGRGGPPSIAPWSQGPIQPQDRGREQWRVRAHRSGGGGVGGGVVRGPVVPPSRVGAGRRGRGGQVTVAESLRLEPARDASALNTRHTSGWGGRGGEAGWQTAWAREREGPAIEHAGARVQKGEARRLLPHNLTSCKMESQCAKCPSARPAHRGPDSQKLVTHGERQVHSKAVAPRGACPQRHSVRATQCETTRWDESIGHATTAWSRQPAWTRGPYACAPHTLDGWRAPRSGSDGWGAARPTLDEGGAARATSDGWGTAQRTSSAWGAARRPLTSPSEEMDHASIAREGPDARAVLTTFRWWIVTWPCGRLFAGAAVSTNCVWLFAASVGPLTHDLARWRGLIFSKRDDPRWRIFFFQFYSQSQPFARDCTVSKQFPSVCTATVSDLFTCRDTPAARCGSRDRRHLSAGWPA